MGGLVSHGGAAFVASVDDNVAALGIRLCLYGAQDSAAIIGSVSGIDINVERAEAKRAMIS